MTLTSRSLWLASTAPCIAPSLEPHTTMGSLLQAGCVCAVHAYTSVIRKHRLLLTYAVSELRHEDTRYANASLRVNQEELSVPTHQ